MIRKVHLFINIQESSKPMMILKNKEVVFPRKGIVLLRGQHHEKLRSRIHCCHKTNRIEKCASKYRKKIKADMKKAA